METTPEVAFAQKLASNEQGVRDKALKKLRKFLTARSSQGVTFTRDELCKLWKGLHYAMWSQDKPLIQEDLSKRLCSLLKCFSNPSSALDFSAAFFATQANEWNRLDSFRMDKFMMLIRQFFNATLEVLKSREWETALTARLASIIEEEVMDCEKDSHPDGLRLYMADIYLDELAKVGAEELEGSTVTSFLAPFIRYVVHSKRDFIIEKVMKYTFTKILEGSETDTQDEEEEAAPRLKYDLEGISAALFDLAKDDKILQRNRKRVYKLIKRFPQNKMLAKKRKLQDGTEANPKKAKSGDDPASSATLSDNNKENETETTEQQPQQQTPVDQPKPSSSSQKRKEKRAKWIEKQAEIQSEKQAAMTTKQAGMTTKQAAMTETQAGTTAKQAGKRKKQAARQEERDEQAEKQEDKQAEMEAGLGMGKQGKAARGKKIKSVVAAIKRTDADSENTETTGTVTRNQLKEQVRQDKKKRTHVDDLTASSEVETKKKKKGLKSPKAISAKGKDTSKKRVSFALERNASRGLQEFVTSAATTPTPFHPSLSPKHGILKDSPTGGTPTTHLSKFGRKSRSPSPYRGPNRPMTDTGMSFGEFALNLTGKFSGQPAQSDVGPKGSKHASVKGHHHHSSKGHKKRQGKGKSKFEREGKKSKFEKKGRKMKKPKRR